MLDNPNADDDMIPNAFGAPIMRDSVSQQAYVMIRNSLMRSRLKPGQKLIARTVAKELKISVTPVRESLLRLVSEHALTLDERGTVIVPALTLEQSLEIRDLRVLLEGEGAARAARLAAPSQIDELERIHERYARTERNSDFATALTENENFHFAVCRMARSPALFRVVENLWIQFGPTLSYLYDGADRPFYRRKHGHLVVIESLRKKDPELARRAMQQDIIVGGKPLLAKLGQTKSSRAAVKT